MQATATTEVKPNNLIKNSAKAEFDFSVILAFFQGNAAFGITIIGAVTYQAIMVVPGITILMESNIKELANIIGVASDKLNMVTFVITAFLTVFFELVVFLLVFNGKETESYIFGAILTVLSYSVKHKTIDFSAEWDIWFPSLLLALIASILPVYIAHTLGSILFERMQSKSTTLGKIGSKMDDNINEMLENS